MKRLEELRELIPAIVTLAFIVSVAGLVLEVTAATIKGTATDAIAMGTFGGLATTALGVLVPLYLRDSKPAPPSDPPRPPPEAPDRHSAEVVPTGDEESDQWNRERGYFQFRRAGRWRRWA